MIVGLGIDLVECSRFERELAQGEWTREDGVFTGKEILYCRAGKHAARRYATCFAAKEATLKALGTGAGDLASFREVELRVGSGSECRIVLHGRLVSKVRRLGARYINLAIAAAKKQTGAMVILES